MCVKSAVTQCLFSERQPHQCSSRRASTPASEEACCCRCCCCWPSGRSQRLHRPEAALLGCWLSHQRENTKKSTCNKYHSSVPALQIHCNFYIATPELFRLRPVHEHVCEKFEMDGSHCGPPGSIMSLEVCSLFLILRPRSTMLLQGSNPVTFCKSQENQKNTRNPGQYLNTS